ncbi:barstar (barnase inhibitor) [Streptomyces puniciscabiei]|uniref:Barstar (Barnase inhibitor) n=1 Tax=Streptomyces puniciscabiei TaxID=164348 RepID=A0A542UMV9_9ACTN|nr:barstar family protein [Streptomyces puniciscabiei]TQL00431.1 barstar (barnase inhibitor) [Streptomyces puniciscabiei]
MTQVVVTLDLDGVTDKAGLMDAVARTLALPDWFGRNWDALLDSLSDPSVWPREAADRGLLLVVTGWRPYADGRPEEWRMAREVLTEAADRTGPLTVALALE